MAAVKPQDANPPNMEVRSSVLPKVPETMLAHEYPHQRTIYTDWGFRFQFWALFVYMLFLFLGLAYIFIMNYFFGSNVETANMIAIMSLGMFTFSLLAILIVSIVLWCIGLFFYNKGKDEFGEEHRTKVERSLRMFSIILFLYIAYIILIFGFVISAIEAPSTILPARALSIQILIFATDILGLIAGVIVALYIVTTIIEFADDLDQLMLLIGFLLNIIAMLFTFILSYRYESIDVLLAETIIIVMTIIAFLMYMYVYRHVYLKIKKGEIKPVPEPI